MIYVIQSSGKGIGYAVTVMLRTFLSDDEASKYISENTRKQSEGHKYWNRFDIVEPGQSVENYSE